MAKVYLPYQVTWTDNDGNEHEHQDSSRKSVVAFARKLRTSGNDLSLNSYSNTLETWIPDETMSTMLENGHGKRSHQNHEAYSALIALASLARQLAPLAQKRDLKQEEKDELSGMINKVTGHIYQDVFSKYFEDTSYHGEEEE